jgi:murein DD-endopeptidase MepM/ murein hydrolase activator NlpD
MRRRIERYALVAVLLAFLGAACGQYAGVHETAASRHIAAAVRKAVARASHSQRSSDEASMPKHPAVVGGAAPVRAGRGHGHPSAPKPPSGHRPDHSKAPQSKPAAAGGSSQPKSSKDPAVPKPPARKPPASSPTDGGPAQPAPGAKTGVHPRTGANPSGPKPVTPAAKAEPKKEKAAASVPVVQKFTYSYAQHNGTVLPADFPFVICPVQGRYSYSDDFGDPRCLSGDASCGGVHTHQGNDIFTDQWTPIVAPMDGLAQDATNTVGGLAVHVYGRQGYVYNAHLVAIRTQVMNTYVPAGTVVGWVGNTGDAQGGAFHDHFEWHPGNGDAIDPFQYLYVVCPPG